MFGDDEYLQVYLRRPRLIMANSAELQRSFDYLAAIDAFDMRRLQKEPRLLMRGCDTILAPRHDFLNESDLLLRAMDDNKWIRASDRDFVALFPEYAAWRAASRFGALPMPKKAS